MSWEAVISPGVSLSLWQVVVLIAAALGAIVLLFAAIKRRAEPAPRRDEIDTSPEAVARPESDDEALDSLEDDDFLKQLVSSHADDPDFDEIPSFTSLPETGEGSGRDAAAGTSSKDMNSGGVSSLLFRLLGTKARIVELERAEKNKSQVLSATREILESLKESLEGSSSDLHEEIDEMHELIVGELSASHQSIENVQQLKEIIDAQYDLLNKPGAVYSADLLLAKQSYVESIDASLDRRLRNAEKREIEFALGKERIMTLKKQMVRLKDSEADSTRAH